MKILNLYAGIGGNRRLWDGDIEVTAVEIDMDIAQIYQDFFPGDQVIVGDAHEFLLEHYKEYDFIWSSPPCPTHSRTQYASVFSNSKKAGTKKREAVYPDMDLYQEIILLSTFAKKKTQWCIENVISYYKPLIAPSRKISRHYFWSNFYIPSIDVDTAQTKRGAVKQMERKFGFDLGNYSNLDKRQVLRNCVHPELGLHVFEVAKRKIFGGNETDNAYKELMLI